MSTRVTGSIEAFTNNKIYCIKMYFGGGMSGQGNVTTGNIENIFKSCSKGFYYIYFVGEVYTVYIMEDNGITNYYNSITGSISVLGDKYDLKDIAFENLPSVTGNISMLNKLQKLKSVYIKGSGITGAKTDLYNSGANLTYFEGGNG